ncbi:MAG: FKBP-type peptidyl-prolyl cis-trans isomerase [Vicingaceae bacterium]|nr:FKBP-type peptidyl-prolyl cis-trans isomerase [Vicingaceae bacterium]
MMFNKYIITYFLIGLFSLCLLSCEEDKPIEKPDTKKVKEALIEANKQAVEKEQRQINGYIERRKLDVISTGTGVHYQIIKKGEGEKAVEGKKAVVSYEVSLIDGTMVYSTKEKGPEEFMVGEDNVETGLHEAITYLHVGDRAIIIIPSYLAHGLAGDFDKIPVRSTIIYNLELIAIK